jgi:hypothetical protein
MNIDLCKETNISKNKNTQFGKYISRVAVYGWVICMPYAYMLCMPCICIYLYMPYVFPHFADTRSFYRSIFRTTALLCFVCFLPRPDMPCIYFSTLARYTIYILFFLGQICHVYVYNMYRRHICLEIYALQQPYYETFKLEWSSSFLIWAAVERITAQNASKESRMLTEHFSLVISLFRGCPNTKNRMTTPIQRSYYRNTFLLWCGSRHPKITLGHLLGLPQCSFLRRGISHMTSPIHYYSL